ncbi:MAG: tetratricopeptide repeat protein [Geobacter sp.]|nr:tetratricopeptide repeat protein [Geobacter sp.]
MRPALLLPALALCVLASGPAHAESTASEIAEAAIGAPFEHELYELAYKVFLANNNADDAFRLAEAALKARPRDTLWRRRAVQAALWRSRTTDALVHLSYLALSAGDAKALEQALTLAEGINDQASLKPLLALRLKKRNDAATLREYVKVVEALGEPEEAVATLKRYQNGPYRREVLELLARLYESTGNPAASVKGVDLYAHEYPVTVPLAMLRSRLLYGTGDIAAACRSLQEGAASAKPADTDFWMTLSDLCWAMQDGACAVNASSQLIAGGAGREDDYQRMVTYYLQHDPERAYATAREGWQRFRKEYYFVAAVEAGLALGRHDELLAFVGNLDEQQRSALARSGYAWQLRSRLYRQAGRTGKSLHSYQQALALEPGNAEVAAGYLWLLIDLEKTEELRETAELFRYRFRGKPELLDPLGAAYAWLGDYRRALDYYRLNYHQRRDDPLWLADYAELLDQAHMADSAYRERLRALLLVRQVGAGGTGGGKEPERPLLKTRLLLLLNPGDATDAAFGKLLADDSGNGATRELLVAWALSTERNDYARLWRLRRFGLLARQPRWAQLSLALEENDTTAIADLLQKDLERLPYRDAIEGARRTGQFPLAADHAFNRFDRNPEDELLDLQFRELAVAHPSQASAGLRLMDRGGIGFIQTAEQVSRPLTNRYSLAGRFSYTGFGTLKDDVVGTMPDRDVAGQLSLSTLFGQGRASVSVGGRSSLNSFAFVGLDADYRLSSTLSLELSADWSGLAEETAPLQIGGLKDRLTIGITHQLSGRDTLSWRGSVYSLRDQWRRELGNGGSIEAEAVHRLSVAYPDLLVRGFAGGYQYSRTGAPEGETYLLQPAGSVPDSGYFVPHSFVQVGIGTAVGSSAREGYSRCWQPYGSADLLWNSESGVGFHYDIGLAGPLIGYDRLIFGVAQDSGRFGSSDLNSLLEMQYRYYFN